MILNHAADIQREDIPTNFVYHGNVLVWCRTRIAVVPASGGTAIYFGNFYEACNFLYNNGETMYNVSVLGCRQIPPGAFIGVRNMLTLSLPYGVTRIGESAFNWCSGLSQINIPDSIKIIEKNAFSNAQALRNIAIPGGIETISERTFYNCVGLQNVTMRSGIEYIGEKAFTACHTLESVTFPDTLLEIGSEAFSHCYVLDNIVIPASVTTIANDAFYDDTAYITITIQKPEGSISGAPWGATHATMIWTG